MVMALYWPARSVDYNPRYDWETYKFRGLNHIVTRPTLPKGGMTWVLGEGMTWVPRFFRQISLFTKTDALANIPPFDRTRGG